MAEGKPPAPPPPPPPPPPKGPPRPPAPPRPPPRTAQTPLAPPAAPTGSVERVAAKESFSADEPLPAFTYPAVDEETKQAIIRSVEEKRAASRAAQAGPPVQSPTAVLAPPPPPTPKAVLGPPPPRARRAEAAKGIAELRRIGLDVWKRSAALGHEAWKQASALTARGIDRASAFIDGNRSRLPARLQAPLAKVSARTILAILAALLVGLVALVALLSGGGGHTEKAVAEPTPSASAPPPAPEEDTVPREIEEAKKQGVAALEKLAERFPKDHRVWLAVAAENSEKAIYPAAVEAVGKALAIDAKASEQTVASDALAAAVRKRDTTNVAFDMLAGPMGSAGATVIYDLSIDPEVRTQLRTRAEEWVKSDAFKKIAEPDLLIAGALRYAGSCSDRHDLLPRASDNGGKRTLDFLNIAKAPGGCGRRARNDCFPCLRKDNALKDAISSIESRLAGK